VNSNPIGAFFLLKSFGEKTAAVFATLLVRHRRFLGRPLEPILVQELAALQFGLEQLQRSTKGGELKALHILHKRPELRSMQRHAAANLVGHGPMVMAALI